MYKQIYFFSAILLFSLSWAISIKAQIAAGGSYTIEKSVVANGGASGNAASAGGNYRIEGTIGQIAAGTKQQNANFTFQPGFWNAVAPNLAPTAAEVSVSGRVLTADGRGIRNVLITMTKSNGEARTVISSAFGYFRFEDVAAGETYIFSVSAKRYTFSQPTLIRSIAEDIDDVIFTANDANQTPAMSLADAPQP